MLTATSDNTILGTGTYKLIHAELHNIPAHWNVNWSGGQLLVEARDALNNPAPMGLVAATVSTSDSPGDNAANILPFQVSGPGGARVNYSPYLQEIDNRYFSLGTGAPVTLAQGEDGAHRWPPSDRNCQSPRGRSKLEPRRLWSRLRPRV